MTNICFLFPSDTRKKKEKENVYENIQEWMALALPQEMIR